MELEQNPVRRIIHENQNKLSVLQQLTKWKQVQFEAEISCIDASQYEGCYSQLYVLAAAQHTYRGDTQLQYGAQQTVHTTSEIYKEVGAAELEQPQKKGSE